MIIPTGQSEPVIWRKSENKIQWLKDKQCSTNYYIENYCIDWTPLEKEGKLRCSGRVNSSCSTRDICRIYQIWWQIMDEDHCSLIKPSLAFRFDQQSFWNTFLLVKPIWSSFSNSFMVQIGSIWKLQVLVNDDTMF